MLQNTLERVTVPGPEPESIFFGFNAQHYNKPFLTHLKMLWAIAK
jgi:hypothetical protein